MSAGQNRSEETLPDPHIFQKYLDELKRASRPHSAREERDAYTADLDFYTYVGDDPTDKVDPSGKCPICVTIAIGAAAGAVGGAVSSGLTEALTPGATV